MIFNYNQIGKDSNFSGKSNAGNLVLVLSSSIRLSFHIFRLTCHVPSPNAEIGSTLYTKHIFNLIQINYK